MMKVMYTFQQAMAKTLLEFPNAELIEDLDGQIVIYTGLYPTEDGEFYSYDNPEDMYI